MTIGAFRITGTLGAEIRGVDLSKPLSKELAADTGAKAPPTFAARHAL